MSRRLRLSLAVLLALGTIGLYAYFQPGRLFTLERLKEASGDLAARRDEAPGTFAAGYFALYVVLTSMAIPGAPVLTIGAGALFGLGRGTLLVSFASTSGQVRVPGFAISLPGPGSTPVRCATEDDQREHRS